MGKEEIGYWRRWGEMSGSLSIALLRINSNWRQVLYKLLPTDRLMYAWGEGEGVTAHSSLVDRHSLSKERGQFSFRPAGLFTCPDFLKLNSIYEELCILTTQKQDSNWGISPHLSLVDRHSLSKERGSFSFRLAFLLGWTYVKLASFTKNHAF